MSPGQDGYSSHFAQYSEAIDRFNRASQWSEAIERSNRVRHQSDTIELGNREREAVDTHEATRDKTEPNRVELFPTDHPPIQRTDNNSLPPSVSRKKHHRQDCLWIAG